MKILISIFIIFLSNYIFSYELSDKRIKILDELMNNLKNLAKLKTIGFIITNSTSTLYQNIYGETDKINLKSPFILGSVSKSFTALALLHLNINLNQVIDKFDLSNYIDEDDAKDITISQLLSHTSGLDSFSSRRLYKKGEYHYSNYGFALLGKIIEKQSGTSYEDYVKKTIFKPLNMSNSYAKINDNIVNSYDNFFGFTTKHKDIESETDNGFYIPAGFISSSVEDMGNYLRFYLRKDPEAQKYIKQMTTGNIETKYNQKYGMGMMIKQIFNYTIYFHGGATQSFLCNLVIYPDLDIGFFIVTNTHDNLCSSPASQLFTNIENYLIYDSYEEIDGYKCFLTHFTCDILILISLALPIIYLIITIIRKIKCKKYLWLNGIKGKVFFGIDIFILVIVPLVLIIFLYTFDANIKINIEYIKDLQLWLFAPSSILFFIFFIKLIYIILYNKCLYKYSDDNIKRLSTLSEDLKDNLNNN